MKGCPFCGSIPVIHLWRYADSDFMQWGQIICKCGISLPAWSDIRTNTRWDKDNETLSIAKWNTREKEEEKTD